MLMGTDFYESYLILDTLASLLFLLNTHLQKKAKKVTFFKGGLWDRF